MGGEWPEILGHAFSTSKRIEKSARKFFYTSCCQRVSGFL
jgi:hypothetical protein